MTSLNPKDSLKSFMDRMRVTIMIAIQIAVACVVGESNKSYPSNSYLTVDEISEYMYYLDSDTREESNMIKPLVVN